MKKLFCGVAIIASATTLTFCDSKTENHMEDQAEKVELHAEMAGDTALARQARAVKDSVDKADPE
ncbi:hypothetical protein [Rufibacter roseus]|uniref:Secreted protein n=1 Tax=Rufibacter roseus TaxID=1567108 RepID=A0ABW2DGT5_9BACT|nr:hypothetical protein [Rufibacter roseus]